MCLQMMGPKWKVVIFAVIVYNVMSVTHAYFPHDEYTTEERDISLESRQLHTLDEFEFNEYSHLIKLELTFSSLVSISLTAFMGTSVTYLNLDNNQLTTLPDALLPMNQSIEKLSMSNNQLTSLNFSILHQLQHLRGLNLTHNQISDITYEEDTGGLLLDYIDLQGNGLTYPPVLIFMITKMLNLSNNPIQDWSAESWSLALCPDVSGDLSHLDLSDTMQSLTYLPDLTSVLTLRKTPLTLITHNVDYPLSDCSAYWIALLIENGKVQFLHPNMFGVPELSICSSEDSFTGCADINFSTLCLSFFSSMDLGFFLATNLISSIAVRGEHPWVAYSNGAFTGTPWVLGPGNYPQPGVYFGDDAIDSIKPLVFDRSVLVADLIPHPSGSPCLQQDPHTLLLDMDIHTCLIIRRNVHTLRLNISALNPLMPSFTLLTRHMNCSNPFHASPSSGECLSPSDCGGSTRCKLQRSETRSPGYMLCEFVCMCPDDTFMDTIDLRLAHAGTGYVCSLQDTI